MRFLRVIIVFILCIKLNTISAQNAPVPMYKWRLHLPYQNALKIAETEDKIYCASQYGLFVFVKDGGYVERITKSNGFSGYMVSCMKYNEEDNTLLIVYNDCTIDILQQNRITTNLDIKNKTITGNKTITHIYFHSGKAYLSASFGLVEFNYNKNEVSNSYLNIGANGSSISVNSSSVLNDSIYISTANGILKAKLSSQVNLNDYNNWKATAAPQKFSKWVAGYKNSLFAEIDSQVYVYRNNAWSLYENYNGVIVSNIDVFHNKLVIGVWGHHIITENENGAKNYFNVNQLNDCLIDSKGGCWYASPINGLVYKDGTSEITYYPNGPRTADNFMFINAYDKLWLTAGGYKPTTQEPTFNHVKYFVFDNFSWQTAMPNPIEDSLYDFKNMAYNEQNKILYIGTHGKGILQMNNGIPSNVYDNTNAPLQKNGGLYTIISGLALDKNNNLWVSNYNADSSLLQLNRNGNWYRYKLSNGNNTKILIDSRGTKWMASPNSSAGILVYDDKNTPTLSDDVSLSLSTVKGAGNLPSNNITDIAFTKQGELLIGSDLGYMKIASPGNIFSGGDFDAQRVIIGVEAGTNLGGYLLGSEYINCIEIDGNDRRWFGTNNGVWLIDNDGETIIHHFTTDNSPLLTNEIKNIGIDNNTGEVFFGTNLGVISFMSDATPGAKNFDKLKIFPNPVRPEYEGEITIQGLIDNTLVKITDINGNLIYQTISNGGTATWNGKTFNGNRPSTGVYLVYCINQDGTQNKLGKILFIK